MHALEGFEDHPAYGARHVKDMGFSDGDLLIGCTEGGETPYVIGAAQKAAEISSNPPFFLYCNPDSALTRNDSLYALTKIRLGVLMGGSGGVRP